MFDQLTITVMLGGPSEERIVSLKSGRAVAAALRGLGHVVAELDPKEPGWTLPHGTELVFVALHGTYGEDGTIQRRLEELEMPFTGCDSESSCVAFDKALTKRRCLDAGLRTARFEVLRSVPLEWPAGWEPPVVLKPLRQGSSIGLQFVNRHEEFLSAVSDSFRFDTEVLLEERILGRETTVGILDDRALPIVEIRPKSGEYDFQNKYSSGATEYFCPARFDPAVTANVQAAGLEAFRAVNGRDYGRVDIMVRSDGEPVVLEVNTLPGMTETSLLPMAAAADGLSFEALCQRMVDLAMSRAEGVQL
ncbi:MAG: D-alanine--D-alanine ligase [Verrucomicrobia bacterium]|nr:D-alanine--D-alanine ligase [Verrucomicrobiota bacterium]